MALNPNTNPTMVGRITAPSAAYPYGSSKDETGPGAGDGTPYFKARADDIFGFQQWLLSKAGITPTGNADSVTASQYGQAVIQLSMGVPYDATVDYPTNVYARGSDNEVYECLIANGPSSSVVNPVGDTTGTWKPYNIEALNTTRLLHVQHQTTGNGGDFASGSWQVAPLNTVVENNIAGSSLSSNEVTLPKGKYYCEAVSVSHRTDSTQARLYDVTGATGLLLGTVGDTDPGGGDSYNSTIRGTFTLSVASNVRIEGICDSTQNTNGWGENGANTTTNVFRDIVFWKVG